MNLVLCITAYRNAPKKPAGAFYYLRAFSSLTIRLFGAAMPKGSTPKGAPSQESAAPEPEASEKPSKATRSFSCKPYKG